MVKASRLPTLRLSGVLIPVALMGACNALPSHIHDASSQALAEKASQSLDSYTTNSPAVYDAMLTNLEKFKVEEDKAIAEFVVNRTNAEVEKLPKAFGFDLERFTKTYDDRRTALDKEILDASNLYLQSRKMALADIETAKGVIATNNKAIAAAQKDLTRWNQTIAVLEKGISEVPVLLASAPSTTTSPPAQSIEQRLGAIGSEEVTFVNADGKTGTITIKDYLQNEVTSAVGTPNGFKLPEAPGITIRILTLGRDLALIQKDVAQAKLDMLSRRSQLIEDAFAQLQIVDALVGRPIQPAGAAGSLGPVPLSGADFRVSLAGLVEDMKHSGKVTLHPPATISVSCF